MKIEGIITIWTYCWTTRRSQRTGQEARLLWLWWFKDGGLDDLSLTAVGQI